MGELTGGEGLEGEGLTTHPSLAPEVHKAGNNEAVPPFFPLTCQP